MNADARMLIVFRKVFQHQGAEGSVPGIFFIPEVEPVQQLICLVVKVQYIGHRIGLVDHFRRAYGRVSEIDICPAGQGPDPVDHAAVCLLLSFTWSIQEGV